MLSYDTTARRVRRVHIVPCADAYLRLLASYREQLARRVHTLTDFRDELPNVNLTALLRLIDNANTLTDLDTLDRIVTTCER